MPSDPIQPFDPNVPSGYSTNLMQRQRVQAPPSSEPQIFTGWSHGTSVAPSSGGKFASETGMPVGEPTPYSTRTPLYYTPTQLLYAFDHFGREDFLKFRNLFIAAGLVGTDADPATVRSAYAGVIADVAAAAEANPGLQLSPMGLVKNYIRMNGLDPSQIGADENYSLGYTGSKTQVSRNVTDITEGQAWASIQNTLSQMLGRDPSDQELRDFTYRMNRMAADNPSISRTITVYKNGGDIASSRTHTDPGFTMDDVAQEAYDQAQNEPDYAEYHGASYLFNAAMSALGPLGG